MKCCWRPLAFVLDDDGIHVLRISTVVVDSQINVEFPHSVLEVFCSIGQQDDTSLVAISCFIQDIDLQTRKIRDRFFKHFTQGLHSHFQILLVVFEDMGEVIAGEVERESVRPFQRLSTQLERLRCCLEKLNLDPGHPGLRLQARHLLLRLQVQVLVKLCGLLMIGVAIVVMQVSLQGVSRFRLRITGFGAGLFLKAVAIIPARPMLRPQTHTHPAKLMLALSTRHVIATTILLDG